MIESRKTELRMFELSPIVVFDIIDSFTVTPLPKVASGPIIELDILQFLPIKTGGIIKL